MPNDTRENPDGQTPRVIGEFRIPITFVPDNTAAWLDRLARAEALGRASGIAAERERCAKVARDTNYECDFLVWSDACNTIARRIESGE